ncbi:hypothetical protein [uncultured Thiothrix sp.]|uniref:hypothetical protein n=1 Tax=uncultured Thiothrix sp. TaxID=223185 RepID=UPI00260444C3|nr:hypothetical protein [uncultured Thiothrix sp.]
MKMKTQFSLAAIFLAGLITSGCSQMSAQQVAQAAPAATPAPGKVITITDCSKCPPRPRVGGGKIRKGGGVRRGGGRSGLGGRHSHPAIPGCTNSITHSHPYTNPRHTHKYSCKGGKPNRGGKGFGKPRPSTGGKWGHTHPAIPGCTNSITHTHPYTNPNHSHHYSCKGGMRPQPQQQIMVPPVKAKGNFKGPIQIDQGTMKQYRQ